MAVKLTTSSAPDMFLAMSTFSNDWNYVFTCALCSQVVQFTVRPLAILAQNKTKRRRLRLKNENITSATFGTENQSANEIRVVQF